jgi:hypothetical protein
MTHLVVQFVQASRPKVLRKSLSEDLRMLFKVGAKPSETVIDVTMTPPGLCFFATLTE